MKKLLAIITFIIMICPWQMTVFSSSAISLDVNDFENRMNIGETQTIGVVLYPSNANDEIKYASSNNSVATISAGGKIEALSAGTTTITVTAGNASKILTLTVAVDTSDISLNVDYIILKKGEKYRLRAKVTPSDANQAVTFRSCDTAVAKVDSNGLIKAVGVGSTSIIVSNGELSISTSVIVNRESSSGGTMSFNDDIPEEQQSEEISSDKTTTEKTLRSLQKSGKTQTIENDDYDIVIDGTKIVNSEIEINKNLYIEKCDEGYKFSLGQDTSFLPGELKIQFKNTDMKKCLFVYLKDKESGKYRFFSELLNGEYSTDIAGEYCITYEKIKGDEPNKSIILIAGISILSLGAIYILLKQI